MARKRMIDPSFWRDEKIAKCTYIERLLFQGLWTFAEDSGVGRANPLLIKADVFPYDPLRASDIESGLDKLSSLGLILLFEVESQRYYYIINFLKHQTINRPSKYYLPLPPEGALTEHSLNTHGALTPNISKDNIKEINMAIDNFFCTLWNLYPRKEGKGSVSKAQKEKLYKIGLDEMVRAIDRYKEVTKNTERRYLKHGSTFFNSGYVDYLDENYEPEPQTNGLRDMTNYRPGVD